MFASGARYVHELLCLLSVAVCVCVLTRCSAEAHELALDATLGMVRRCMLQREGARSMELVALELRALAE